MGASFVVWSRSDIRVWSDSRLFVMNPIIWIWKMDFYRVFRVQLTNCNPWSTTSITYMVKISNFRWYCILFDVSAALFLLKAVHPNLNPSTYLYPIVKHFQLGQWRGRCTSIKKYVMILTHRSIYLSKFEQNYHSLNHFGGIVACLKDAHIKYFPWASMFQLGVCSPFLTIINMVRCFNLSSI